MRLVQNSVLRLSTVACLTISGFAVNSGGERGVYWRAQYLLWNGRAAA